MLIQIIITSRLKFSKLKQDPEYIGEFPDARGMDSAIIDDHLYLVGGAFPLLVILTYVPTSAGSS